MATLWPKHVGNHNTIKVINKIKVHFLILNNFYASNKCMEYGTYQTYYQSSKD